MMFPFLSLRTGQSSPRPCLDSARLYSIMSSSCWVVWGLTSLSVVLVVRWVGGVKVFTVVVLMGAAGLFIAACFFHVCMSSSNLLLKDSLQ